MVYPTAVTVYRGDGEAGEPRRPWERRSGERHGRARLRSTLHAPRSTPPQGAVTRCAVSVPSPVTVAVTLFAPNVALATGVSDSPCSTMPRNSPLASTITPMTKFWPFAVPVAL